MPPVLQMITNLLLYQVTAKEGHYTEPRGTGDPNDDNHASQRWHSRRYPGAAGDPESHPNKCSKSVDANDNFRKSTIAGFASHVDATDNSERVYTNPVSVTV